MGFSFSIQATSTEVIQKKSVRNICNATYNAHTGPLFKQLRIPKLVDIYNSQLCKLMYLFTSGTLPCPLQMVFKRNCIPEILNFGDVMVLVWTQPPQPPPPHPPPPHAKACVSRNCDTNARIKFIFDTAIDTLEWKNPIDFGENRKTEMAAKRPFCENMMKTLVHSITSSKMHRSTSYLI